MVKNQIQYEFIYDYLEKWVSKTLFDFDKDIQFSQCSS